MGVIGWGQRDYRTMQLTVQRVDGGALSTANPYRRSAAPSVKRDASVLPKFTSRIHFPLFCAEDTRHAPAPVVVPVLTPSTAPSCHSNVLRFVQVCTVRPSAERAVQTRVETTRSKTCHRMAALVRSTRSLAVVTWPYVSNPLGVR